MLYADDAGIVSKSTENLAKMTVIVTVCESAGLTVPKTKTETTLLRALRRFSRPHRSWSKRRARGTYADDAFSVPVYGLIIASADIMP